MEGQARTPGGPSDGVTRLAELAQAGMGRERQSQVLAYLWLALDWLVAGDPAYRMDALAPMSHDALRLLAAQATTELRLLGGTSPIGEPEDDHAAIYLAAAGRSKRELRAAVDSLVTQLGERGWQPPPVEDDDEEGEAEQ